jgi:acyl-CoA synthetase (AMP-forming)/AMP-acid ligase II
MYSLDAQMNWRSNIVREPSTMSAPSRMNPSLVGGTPNLEVSPPIRRARSNRTRGRSRYQDSYMASTFKAIEPAPQPILSLHDPSDRIFLEDLVGRQSIPLKGRPIPFPLIDGSNQVDLTEFENLAQVLRYRGCKSGNRLNDAFLLVDPKGKESATITWDKLNAKAEKIAHQIREKGKLQAGDRVALIYRKSEVLDFIPALLGCFLAGVVAVPINAAEDLSELAFVLTLTNIHLILTTEHNQKAFAKDMQTKSVELPGNIKWWKTNDMGTWYTTKKMPEYPPIIVPDLAYIEYAKASNGELKGVTVSHKSIIEQCAAFQAGVTTTDITIEGDQVEVKPKSRRNQNIAVSYFEPRQQIGLILSVLHSIYAGNTMIFASGTIVDTPSVWIYVVSKYKGKFFVHNGIHVDIC